MIFGMEELRRGSSIGVNIQQAGTVAKMKLNCKMNESSKEIDCTTDHELLYKLSDPIAGLSAIPVVGQFFRIASSVFVLGQEAIDYAMDKPFGSTKQNTMEVIGKVKDDVSQSMSEFGTKAYKVLNF